MKPGIISDTDSNQTGGSDKSHFPGEFFSTKYTFASLFISNIFSFTYLQSVFRPVYFEIRLNLQWCVCYRISQDQVLKANVRTVTQWMGPDMLEYFWMTNPQLCCRIDIVPFLHDASIDSFQWHTNFTIMQLQATKLAKNLEFMTSFYGLTFDFLLHILWV